MAAALGAAALAAACGAPAPPPAGADAARVMPLFLISCAPCHGREAQGVRGVGPDLRGNAFVAARSDAELVAFLARGRPAGDPDNRTGIVMPPRGGNPALTDADLAALVAFLRSLAAP